MYKRQLLFCVFMLGTFGLNFQITNALMATQVFGVGPEGLSLIHISEPTRPY